MIDCRIPERVMLGNWPTPLQEMPRLALALGGPRLFIKRDDETGCALSGNKIRELEFLFAEALAAKADVIITCGRQDSNHVRLTTAAANKLGLRTVLVLDGGQAPPEPKGNLLLDMVLGAELHFIPSADWANADRHMEDIAAACRRKGQKPYIVPKGAACPMGSIGYALAVKEMAAQAVQLGANIKSIVVSSGTGGTQAGVVVGCRVWWPQVKVIGCSVGPDPAILAPTIARLARGAAQSMGVATEIKDEDIILHGEFVGAGYGALTDDARQAIREFARYEGVILDPIYTAKGAAGLLALIRSKGLDPGDIVFLHTGGVPALFSVGAAVL